MAHIPSESIIGAIQDAYSARAKSGTEQSYSTNVARAFGYTAEQLQAIPVESNLGLGCGNPVASASIKEGERILDLGCGGGIDILLAALKIGPMGQAIGLDMSADMIALARRNAQKQNLRPPQVSFVHTSLTEPLPITSGSIDCIISNCVINMLPFADKGNLLKEAFRVLKPGGRVVFDDMIAKSPLPDDIRNDLTAHVGCIAGAITEHEYKRFLLEAGFSDLVIVDTRRDINAYYPSQGLSTMGCCPSPLPNSKFQKNPASIVSEPADQSSSAGCCAPQSTNSNAQKSCSPASTVSQPADKPSAAGCCAPSSTNANARKSPSCAPIVSESADKSSSAGCCAPSSTNANAQKSCSPASTLSQPADKSSTAGSCCGPPSTNTSSEKSCSPASIVSQPANKSSTDTCCTPQSTSAKAQKSCSPASTSSAVCCAPQSTKGEVQEISSSAITTEPPTSNVDANQWVSSSQIYALKPIQAGEIAAEAPDPLLQWWAAYPSAKSSTEFISSDEVALMIRNKSLDSSHYAVIDVRRNDHAGGHVRGSTQCAAQTFYDELPEFLAKFGQTSKVIFYCSSSNGRGPRCAGWYQDNLDSKGVISSKAYVLKGGMKEWLVKFGGDAELIDKD